MQPGSQAKRSKTNVAASNGDIVNSHVPCLPNRRNCFRLISSSFVMIYTVYTIYQIGLLIVGRNDTLRVKCLKIELTELTVNAKAAKVLRQTKESNLAPQPAHWNLVAIIDHDVDLGCLLT